MSDHFVIELNIKSVKKPAPAAPGRSYQEQPNANTADGGRIIEDVARVVFKSDSLIGLVTKTKDHLDIIAEVEDHA